MSTKPERFLIYEYGQNSIPSISNFFEKNQLFGFPCCSTGEDFFIEDIDV